RLLGQVFASDHTAHCQLDRQLGGHALERQQVFGGLGVRQFLFGSNGLGQQPVFGPHTQLVDDVLVEAVDAEHLLHRNVSNFLETGEAFLDQYLGQLLVDPQLVDEVLDDVAGLGLLLGLDVGLAHHVQGPAGQLAGQANVLTATADGLRQVVLADRDVHGMGILVNDDRHHFGRRHGVDDELRRVVVPEHDVDTLAAQFTRHGLDARTAHADAGALRVDALVLGAHGNLGARTRVAGSAHHLDQTFGDLRHLDAEQLDEHFRSGAREDQLRAAVLGADFLQQRANAHANPEGLARNDVLAGQQGLGVVAQVDDDVVAGHLLHGTEDDVADLVAVGVDHLGTLSLADLLNDDLLGGLRGDA